MILYLYLTLCYEKLLCSSYYMQLMEFTREQLHVSFHHLVESLHHLEKSLIFYVGL